jgi:hypothetical protein
MTRRTTIALPRTTADVNGSTDIPTRTDRPTESLSP